MNAYIVPKEPEFLFVVSSKRFNVLLPSQAYDWSYKEDCQNAFYATSNRDMALAFALGVVPDETGHYDRIMDHKHGVNKKERE